MDVEVDVLDDGDLFSMGTARLSLKNVTPRIQGHKATQSTRDQAPISLHFFGRSNLFGVYYDIK